MLVTDDRVLAGRDPVALARAAERGGVTSVQLRLKRATPKMQAALARELVGALRIPVLVNDRPDVALAAGAAGVHLGPDDLSLPLARRVTPAGFILGASAGSTEEATAAASAGRFDPVSYADEHFESEIVPQIEADAVDLATLLTDLAAGAEEAELGHAPGSGSAYSFPVAFTGIAGAVNGSTLPITVDGVPADVSVQLQVGPAINGTALRDVTGTVSFNDFTNQLDFQQVATEFNNRVREGVLAEAGSIAEGQTVTVTGAFTRINPALVSVVPVAIEVD